MDSSLKVQGMLYVQERSHLPLPNCLNFGNPYNPEVYYQFTKLIREGIEMHVGFFETRSQAVMCFTISQKIMLYILHL